MPPSQASSCWRVYIRNSSVSKWPTSGERHSIQGPGLRPQVPVSRSAVWSELRQDGGLPPAARSPHLQAGKHHPLKGAVLKTGASCSWLPKIVSDEGEHQSLLCPAAGKPLGFQQTSACAPLPCLFSSAHARASGCRPTVVEVSETIRKSLPSPAGVWCGLEVITGL